MPLDLLTEKPWYRKGLRFSCTQCGACCTGFPGYVWLNKTEIEELAHHLNLSKEEFLKCYTRNIKGRISLLEDPNTYDCIFLKNKKCSVYTKRPKQCQTYPFWPSILSSEKSWEEEKCRCEGIQEKAELLSYEEIEAKKRQT